MVIKFFLLPSALLAHYLPSSNDLHLYIYTQWSFPLIRSNFSKSLSSPLNVLNVSFCCLIDVLLTCDWQNCAIELNSQWQCTSCPATVNIYWLYNNLVDKVTLTTQLSFQYMLRKLHHCWYHFLLMADAMCYYACYDYRISYNTNMHILQWCYHSLVFLKKKNKSESSSIIFYTGWGRIQSGVTYITHLHDLTPLSPNTYAWK